MKCLFEVNTICRLCLRVGEKVYKLDTRHKAFIESIIKLKPFLYVLTDDEYYVCYICNALLTKAFNFMRTIWNAQEIICILLKNTDMITKPMLEHIDRHNNGLNPITLSSVVISENVKYDSCDNSFANTDNEELDLDLLIDKIEAQSKKKQKYKNNHKLNKIENHSTNEKRQIMSLTSSSDEDKEPDKCNLDEVEIEIDDIKTEIGDPLTKVFNTDTHNDPKPGKCNLIKNHSTNEKTLIISLSSSSDEDKEPDKCILDEVEIEIDGIKTEIGDPLTKVFNTDTHDDPKPDKCNLDEVEVEIDIIKTEIGDPLTKDFNTNTHDDPKPEPKKKNVTKRIALHKTLNSTSCEKETKRKKKVEKDDDYQPDSTSHSEDSDCDSYDDEGKPIRRPKDVRVYPRKCDHCDYEVLKGCDHYRHYLCAHPNVDYPYKRKRNYACSICGKLYTSALLRSHEASHATQKLKCTLCPNVYSNKIKLYRHMQNVHPKNKFTCDYCSKTFKTRTDFIRHIRIHTGSKPFKCHICGDGFAHSGNRSIHIRTKHQNDKYVPKKLKRTQKVRRNNKHNSTDTE